MFANYFDFLPNIVTALSNLFTLSFTPLNQLIDMYDNPVIDFFYSLVTIVGLGDFLSNINLFTLCFGSGLVIVLVVSLIKWLI